MLRAGVLSTLLVFALHGNAAQFDFLKGDTGAQKEVRTLLESGNYAQALMAWESSFRGTAFGNSPTGLATWAFLLYQNGLPYTAFETLIHNTSPSAIHPQLMKLWTAEMKKSPFIQKGWIPTTGGWKSIVNNEPVSLTLKNKAQVSAAFTRADKASSDNLNQKAKIWWQIATQAPQIGETDSALKALKHLKESGQIVIGQDMVAMTQARVAYQRVDLTGALNFYNQVPKSSSLWLESVEERAWTHLRQDDYDKALGVVTTAMSPVFGTLAGPETYFLANLLAFKVCDYSRVFNNSEAFKKRHKARLNELQALAKTGTNTKIAAAFERFEQNGVSVESAGSTVEGLPRQIFRDQQFLKAMESRRQLLAEFARAGQLFESSGKALGGSSEFERTLSNEKRQAEMFKQKAYQRARALAQNDLKEYKFMLNKLHVIEGGIIERLHLDESLKGERSKLSKVEDQGDVLVFPATDEVWMDELDNYKARVKDCPNVKGASL